VHSWVDGDGVGFGGEECPTELSEAMGVFGEDCDVSLSAVTFDGALGGG
jgi:hypothetical protein